MTERNQRPQNLVSAAGNMEVPITSLGKMAGGADFVGGKSGARFGTCEA